MLITLGPLLKKALLQQDAQPSSFRNQRPKSIRSFQQLSCIHHSGIPFRHPSNIQSILLLRQKIVQLLRSMDAPFSMSRWACSGCIWENPRALPTRNMGSGITSVQSASRGTPQKLRSGHGCDCPDTFAKTQPGLRFRQSGHSGIRSLVSGYQTGIPGCDSTLTESF